MNLFDVLTMIGGLCLFLFGMNVMGDALERRAGNSLESLLSRLTTGKMAGLLTGLVVTGIIQSSSATTVMVVGFVNSSLMTLKQAIHVIMGANIGTTVTAWILSLAGIESSNVVVQLFKPMSFTPVLALIGIGMTMFGKSSKSKDTGNILLGFATLMFGMDIMSNAVAGLENVPAFRQMFIMFQNPILGVLAGAILTGIIQSSSASVGILQSLALTTSQVTYGAAIPIIMGQNIGTCVTALLSSVGTSRNARRAAVVHLMFNIIGTVILLTVYAIVRAAAAPAIFGVSATPMGIAVCHSVFNVVCTALLLPMSGLLEKIACILVPDAKKSADATELDERLLMVPGVALERCRAVAADMAVAAGDALKCSLQCLKQYDAKVAAEVAQYEDKTDYYEDLLGSYLVKLSALKLGDAESAEAAGLLKTIGDYERIADHAMNVVESAQELQEKGLAFSAEGQKEIALLRSAVEEVFDLSTSAFIQRDVQAANSVQPLEEVVDDLKEKLRDRHITRLQKGTCSIEVGFVWADLLTNLERISDHCANVAGCVLDMEQHNLNTHALMRAARPGNPEFDAQFSAYAAKYALTEEV